MLVVILSYILGAIPGGYIINKYFKVNKVISLFSFILSPKLEKFLKLHSGQVISIAADVFKGMITVIIVSYLCGKLSATGLKILIFPFISPGLIHVGVLLFSVLGHVLSVYMCGWGGRGTATAFGGFLFLVPRAAIVAMIIFIIVSFIKRSVQTASIISSWLLPIFIWYFYRANVPYQIASIFLAILSLITHYNFLHSETVNEKFQSDN